LYLTTIKSVVIFLKIKMVYNVFVK